jgi:hypothetical protein
MAAGIRPSSLLFREQPNDPWTDIDFLLVEAMQILEDETCDRCGNPIWVCRNEDADNVGFKIKTAKCFGDAELDKWREQEEKKKNKKKKYGEYPYVVAYTYDDGPLPSRSQFYKSLEERYAVE